MIDQEFKQSPSRSRFAWRLSLCAALLIAACQSTLHHSLEAPKDPLGTLTLEANSECRSTGLFGGAVSPTQWNIRVVNRTDLAATWRVTSDQSWLTIPNDLGTTPARSEGAIVVYIDTDAARTLGPGEHRARARLFTAIDSLMPVSSVDVVLDVDDRAPNGTRSGPGSSGSHGPGTGTSNVEIPDTGHWTTLEPSPDTRMIYVSSSVGNDANSGLSRTQPKATIAAGKALMRNGFPDWLLLHRGDTWAGSFGQWTVSGRSATEPAVVATYGTAELRPHIATGTQDGLITIQNSASPPVLSHIRIIGLRFTCNAYTGAQGTPHGITWHVPFNDVLVEDCSFQYFHTNIVIEPLGEHGRDFRLRRSIVADAFTTQNSHSQGLYMSNTEGVLLEENVFDHNGWREDVPGAVPTIFRHNAYLQTDVTMVRAIGNIFASGASHGLQARAGGLIEDNLFVNNAISLLLGSDWQTKEPIRFIARRNVITSGRDIDPATPRGWGIDVPAAASGLIARNLIVNQRNAGFAIAMNLYDGSSTAGFHEVVVEGNVIHDWHGPVLIQGGAPHLSGFVFRQNVIGDTQSDNLLVENTSAPKGSVGACAENLLWSTNALPNSWCRIGNGNVSLDMWKAAMGDTTSQAVLPAYVDSKRSVETYDERLDGEGTIESFISAACRQSKTRWRPEYTAPVANDWIRAGFRWEQ